MDFGLLFFGKRTCRQLWSEVGTVAVTDPSPDPLALLKHDRGIMDWTTVSGLSCVLFALSGSPVPNS